jgi:hypothetical protein
MVVSPLDELLPSSHILDLNMTYGLVGSPVSTHNFESKAEPISIIEGEVRDCVVTRWSRWSKCSVSCGRGYKTRERFILVS